jgi:hypothetical protein
MRISFAGPGSVYKPHKWFAWHPVKIDAAWVWLETVIRKRCVGRDYQMTEYWDYSLKDEPTEPKLKPGHGEYDGV